MRTYNQIIKRLQQFSLDHVMIRSFGYGTAAMLNDFANNNIALPMLYAQIESIQPRANTVEYVFRFKVLDTRSKAYDNLRDLQSDTAQIMVDVRQWLMYNFEDTSMWIEDDPLGRMTPLVNTSQDWLSGWEMQVTIGTALVESDCLVPIAGEGCELYVEDGYVEGGYVLCEPKGGTSGGELFTTPPEGEPELQFGPFQIPTALLLRRDKGSPLTHDELDDNFVYLDNKVAGVPEAPIDGNIYGRGNNQWIISPVFETVYVDDALGDDSTGKINDPAFPFKTIKAGIDAFSSPICTLKIAAGDYNCPEEILKDVSPKVNSLTIDSKATNITATTSFVQADQAGLYEFNFFGGTTNISSGETTFHITGSNIYNFKLYANNVHGDSTAFQIIHPGTNSILLNGNATSGTGEGYAVSVRGSSFTDIFIRGNIISEGTNVYSAAIMIRDVFGVLNLSWGGILDASGFGHTGAHAVEVANSNVGSKIYLKGDILDERTDTTISAIRLIQNFTHFEHIGNIKRAKGSCLQIVGNSNFDATVHCKGKWESLDGGLVFKSGNRAVDLHLDLIDSYSSTEPFNLNGKITMYLNGRTSNYSIPSPMVKVPTTIPVGIVMVIDDFVFETLSQSTPLGHTGSFTGSLDVRVRGAFRTNSTEPIPGYMNIEWLKDITAFGGDIQTLTPDVNDDVYINLMLGNKFKLTMVNDTKIKLPTDDRGQTVEVLVNNANSKTLTFDAGYTVLGDVPSTEFLLSISYWGDNEPFAVINNKNI